MGSRKKYGIFGSKRNLLRAVFEYAAPWGEESPGLLDTDWIARVRTLSDACRRRDVEALVALLAEVAPLRLGKRHAADVAWAIAVSDLYSRLRKGCGWSEHRTTAFVEDLIARALLP